MKLDEIARVTNTDTNNYQTITSHLENAKHIKDNLYVISVGSETVYCVIIDNVLVAYLVGSNFSNATFKNGFVVGEIYVHKDFRRKGFASRLYNYAYDDLNYTIISDVKQTPDGENLWKQLHKQYGNEVKIFDTVEKVVVNFKDVDSDDLYKNTEKKGNRYRLILQAEEPYVPFVKEGHGIPEFASVFECHTRPFTLEELKWI